MMEKIIRAAAGSFILASLILSYFTTSSWLWFTAFVGANLLQSSITGFCPLEWALKRIGIGERKG